ncbi:sister chromatid cohesion 1 protein 3-like [Magnolia sinica]|uniref:sister chromatid cohesion 1 protein 3-like n=1 Tax=Magnolia sinica TaxID=86752 RepID=UPI00265A5A90|nr:sister chromatid cohesion 1 protein 3-like [Magnolia sinica]XP_058073499.1 sister chromatid cohesion 1 protein 3-like [Magnolia sinica]
MDGVDFLQTLRWAPRSIPVHEVPANCFRCPGKFLLYFCRQRRFPPFRFFSSFPFQNKPYSLSLTLSLRNHRIEKKMFYSHSFLARKSPLGTIWIAAHLQHKLRKSHVVVTDISSSVDRIMFPEVPIALRLSGHLLLGVVRIYSKKVDYLYHDCNEVLTHLRAAFASIQVNLPEDANHASFHSVTLPETFELDILDLDDTIYQTQGPDNHLKTLEEITITDQIPGEGDPYVTFFINEDIMMDTSPVDLQNPGAGPMEEDVVPPLSGSNGVGSTDSGPSNPAEESNQKLCDDRFHEDLPEIEIPRDAVHLESGNIPEFPDFGDNTVEQHEPFDPTLNQKEILSPIMEERESLPSRLHPTPPIAGSAGEPENFDPSISFGHELPEMVLQPTPPVDKKKAKSRKRKQFFDESLVFTNEFMRKQLEDTSKLVCKRKKLPVSALDVWRFHKFRQMEHVFLEPSLSGMSADLQEVFKKTYTASAVDPTPTEAPPEPRNAESPAGMPASDMEIEHPRFQEDHFDGLLPEFMPYPSGREETTPLPASNLASVSQLGRPQETELLPTPELSGYADPADPESQTPMVPSEERLPLRDTSLSRIPDLLNSAESPVPRLREQLSVGEAGVPWGSNTLNSAEAEELNFLEADNSNAQSGGRAESDVDSLSVRTRAVARYLKNQSPATQISKGQSGHLSLNRILEGKTRKQCARMFFETLVLKSYRFIDVQQEEAYGDITLLLTPTLSKAKF